MIDPRWMPFDRHRRQLGRAVSVERGGRTGLSSSDAATDAAPDTIELPSRHGREPVIG